MQTSYFFHRSNYTERNKSRTTTTIIIVCSTCNIHEYNIISIPPPYSTVLHIMLHSENNNE